MEVKKTQLDKIALRLYKFKKISRNWALNHYITRIAAHITTLRDNGWVIKGEYVKGKNGKDFVYKLL